MGRRLTDPQFLGVMAERKPGWDLDERGQFLLLEVAERDLAWVLECCREHAEGAWHMLRDGAAVLFEREHDHAFVRLACL
ncbi:hypothetical protein GCM10010964_30320 [Caldovatus sediminis]|uniref:Uncharacterized protein n=1 Tax=Caldovatus sediminis TaxID=2041189 RepID=A0A8J3ED91_9PROT|nr:hypothetical protein [Caldovatus sediminis]GGG40631.1 hypothetical protein GCM10010964_30320 [Caldovatus sediminis]